MEANSSRDSVGQPESARVTSPTAQCVPDDHQERHRQQRQERHQDRGVEEPRGTQRDLLRLAPHVDGEKDQLANGQREDEVHAPAPEASHRRIPEQTERDRHDSNVKTDEGKLRETCAIRHRALDRDRDLRLEVDTGLTQERDAVRLVLHPGVGNGDGGSVPALQGWTGGDLVLPVGLVDHHLGDRDRVGASVDNLQLDHAGLG